MTRGPGANSGCANHCARPPLLKTCLLSHRAPYPKEQKAAFETFAALGQGRRLGGLFIRWVSACCVGWCVCSRPAERLSAAHCLPHRDHKCVTVCGYCIGRPTAPTPSPPVVSAFTVAKPARRRRRLGRCFFSWGNSVLYALLYRQADRRTAREPARRYTGRAAVALVTASA